MRDALARLRWRVGLFLAIRDTGGRTRREFWQRAGSIINAAPRDLT